MTSQLSASRLLSFSGVELGPVRVTVAAGEQACGGYASAAGDCYGEGPGQHGVDQDRGKGQQRKPCDEGQQDDRPGGRSPRACGGLNERYELGKGVIHGGISRAVGVA
jgi:hypothetical protein